MLSNVPFIDSRTCPPTQNALMSAEHPVSLVRSNLKGVLEVITIDGFKILYIIPDNIIKHYVLSLWSGGCEILIPLLSIYDLIVVILNGF